MRGGISGVEEEVHFCSYLDNPEQGYTMYVMPREPGWDVF